MTSNSGGDNNDSAKSSETPSTPANVTTPDSAANDKEKAASGGQRSATTPQLSSPATSQSSSAPAEPLSPNSTSGSDATLASSPSSKSVSSLNINIFDILSTAAQAIGLASAPATPGGSPLTRLSSATVSEAATATPMSPAFAAASNAPGRLTTSPTFGLGSAAGAQPASVEHSAHRRLRRAGPLHRPQAYIPLELLPKVSLKEDPQVAALEMMNGDPNSSCYTLPFIAADGRQALAVIPGDFLPGTPKPDASGQPATVTNRLIKLGKTFWRRYGWARTESLAGYGKETCPPPEHIEANIADEEIDSYQLYNFQLETVTFVPQWASDYPFHMLYDIGTGFGYGLFDLDALAKAGQPAPPYPNPHNAQFVAMPFCPFDPFDLPPTNPWVEQPVWAQHPARMRKLDMELDMAEARALQGIERFFG